MLPKILQRPPHRHDIFGRHNGLIIVNRKVISCPDSRLDENHFSVRAYFCPGAYTEPASYRVVILYGLNRGKKVLWGDVILD